MKYIAIALLALTACAEKPETLGNCVDKVMEHFKIQEGTFDMVTSVLACSKEGHNSKKIIDTVEEILKGKK